MSQKYTATVMRDEDRWLGWIEEVPGIQCQEHSREALQENLMGLLKKTLLFNQQETFSDLELCFKESG
ncbi:MAG: type II toxin-antitoxin system HicB family antitoxin [Nitrospiria bacterium]